MVAHGLKLLSVSGPTVELADADRSSGMATMLAGLLEANISDFPTRAAAARLARGSLSLLASDKQMAVTLSFRAGSVVVRDGTDDDAPMVSGTWLVMANICSGRDGFTSALVGRRVHLARGASMSVLPAAALALSVPRSFYDDDTAARRRRILNLSLVAVLLFLIATGAGRRRRSRS